MQLEKFPPDGSKASIADLLVFMSRHSLRFAEVDKNGERTYEQLYREMSRYYVDLHGLHWPWRATNSGWR